MIYTGYYANVKKYEEAGLVPVAISGVVPKFFDGFTYKEFAPRKEMFQKWKNGEIDNFEYTEMYKAIDELERSSQKGVRQIIRKYRPDSSSSHIVKKIDRILSIMTKHKVFKIA